MGDEFVLEPVRRAEAFERLLEGETTRAALQDHLDVSRATLHRIVTFLRDHDLLVERDGSLELTALGKLVGREVTGYVDRMTVAGDLAPLVNGVNVDALPEPIDFGLFQGVETTLPKPGQPQRPVQRVIDLVEVADEVRGFGPVVMPIYVEVFSREILDGMETELLVDPSVVEGLETQYAEKLEEAMATGRLDLNIHESLPFGLLLTPDAVALLGYDDDGVLRVVVEGDTERLRSWAETVYESFLEGATPV